MSKNSQRYQVFLLDADGTLLDFDQCQRVALDHMLFDFGYPMTEALLASFHRINQGLWRDLAGGKIKKQELLPKRFQIFAQEAGLNLSPELANRSFLTHLSYQVFAFPGVEDVLRQLSERSRIVIATNGVDFVQKRRFALSGLMPHIHQIVVSEAVGANKPEAAFFEAVLKLAGNPDPSTVLMVGDSPESDIKGANDFGLDSCLYDPQAIYPQADAKYTIRKLEELLEF
ncbi:MAG: noncanonical pyrimidine nucleotidase, YjjG family [Clostridiaceae bacterium]|jgi:2-haloacid dehalogenase|nr:noncanonical pyrimidine nucleotidase, YjjG family [Clostridiaceae bacterium]